MTNGPADCSFEQALAIEDGEIVASNGDIPLVLEEGLGKASCDGSSESVSAPKSSSRHKKTQSILLERFRNVVRRDTFASLKRQILPRLREEHQPTSLHDVVQQVLADLHEKRKCKRQLPGYPEMAAFLGSEESLMMCRRFKTMQARLMLEKQDELGEIEEELRIQDEADAGTYDFDDPAADVPRLLATRRRGNPAAREARQQLINQAAKVFKEYSDLVLAINKMMSLEKPAKYERDNVRKYACGRKPLRPSELEWILIEDDDIVSLRGPRVNGGLGTGLQWLIGAVKAQKDILRAKDSSFDEWTHSNRVSAKRINYSVSILLFTLGPIMLVVPVYVLSIMGDDTNRSIGVLIAFALAFAALLAAGTPAKPHEVLSGSAAYLAVLVVFFGSVTPRSTNS